MLIDCRGITGGGDGANAGVVGYSRTDGVDERGAGTKLAIAIFSSVMRDELEEKSLRRKHSRIDHGR